MNQPDVTSKDRFLSSRQRYQPIALPEDFSDEEMARDWTLSVDDRAVLDRSQKRFRLYGAVQLCAVRLYGRFLDDVRELSPRITNYLNHQLYRVEKDANDSVFAPLLTKIADLAIIEEQWDAMMRLALSLKERTAPAHVIVQRLTNSYPSDRLSKAITNLGRVIKTEYILLYLTDAELRRTVQRQLNKGEYRQKLPRRIFFADQGEFTTGDYVEIVNKASCLSLVSNAILYWNTIKIAETVGRLRAQGEDISDETLSHVSLLPFRHVLPNGTYFIENS